MNNIEQLNIKITTPRNNIHKLHKHPHIQPHLTLFPIELFINF